MAGMRWALCAMVLGLVASSGCCRWCERWCADRNPPAVASYPQQQCVPCCPVVCCPPGGAAPAHYPPATAPVPGQPSSWQRTYTQPVSGNCCQ
ncbi:MAG: hypothetical protein JNM56_16415 [Planctomycetia bacterium]|nr:hypothetical protein [Planctomycetia bacterium]